MPLQLHEITSSFDIPSLVNLTSTTMASAPQNRALYPQGRSPANLADLLARNLKNFENAKGLHVLCVRDDELTGGGERRGEMIAAARWYEKEKVEAEATADPAGSSGSGGQVPPGADKELVEVLRSALSSVRGTTMKGVPRYWELEFLCTSPEHERRGAGTVLMEWGLERADGEGVECYVDSSAVGRPLYEKFGFRVVNSVEVDLTRWGVEEVLVSYAMVRPVKGVAGVDVVGAEVRV